MSTVLVRPAQLSKRSVGTRIASGLWVVTLGLVSGVACVSVRVAFRVLQWIFVQHAGSLPAAAAALSPARRLITPILGAACATAVLWAARKWSQAGECEEYVEAVRSQRGRIPFAPTLWRTASSAFSVATGAAIGREGSMIQFAAAVTSWVGARSPLQTLSLSRQVAYGAAAAVAAAYQAPTAGVFFALEIVIGEWTWAEVPLLALSSCAGWLVSRALLGGGPLFAIPNAIGITRDIFWAVPLALGLGLLALLYNRSLRGLRFVSRWPLALIWAGVLVGSLSLLHPAIWGNGDVALLQTFGASRTVSMTVSLLVLRFVATTFCVGAGTVRGVFTPTLFAGAALGLLSGQLLHLDQPVILAVIGMGAFLSAVTHAPSMATLMAVELTGQWHLFPVVLLCNLFAWIIARRLSCHALYAIATPEPAESNEERERSLIKR
jgi:Chloride channel protein EriC